MKIGNFDLDEKVLIVAELSANHAGRLDLALETVKKAKQAGADAIKIQTYTPNSITLNSKKDDFIIKGGLWDKRTFYELYESAKTPYEWHSLIFEAAQDVGLLCFSSPFCEEDLTFLTRFDPPAYKIASFEANDENFVRLVARQKKPLLISTGIALKEELQRICEICKEEGNEELVFLKCTSSYPADLSDMNLNSIRLLKDEFKCELGLSDHSFSNIPAIIAISLGARVIEKHFCLDKSIKSEDSEFSLDFNEFKSLCEDIRKSELALGKALFNDELKEIKNREFARSLYASADIKKGELFTKDNVRSVRPAFGLHPKYLNSLLGKKAKRDIDFASPLTEEDL